MKVFTVESGDYSDYRVHGVFSTEAQANKWIGDFEGYEVVEREMDDFSDAQVTLGSTIKMDMNTGDVKSIEPLTNNPLKSNYPGPNIDVVKGYGGDDTYLEMSFDHFDKERATKVAGEKRAQIQFHISIFGQLPLKDGQSIEFDRTSCLPTDPEWHKKIKDALEVVESAALKSLDNYGAPQDMFEPESGKFIIRNGKPTQYGKKLLAKYKEQK